MWRWKIGCCFSRALLMSCTDSHLEGMPLSCDVSYNLRCLNWAESIGNAEGESVVDHIKLNALKERKRIHQKKDDGMKSTASIGKKKKEQNKIETLLEKNKIRMYDYFTFLFRSCRVISMYSTGISHKHSSADLEIFVFLSDFGHSELFTGLTVFQVLWLKR